MLKDETKQSTYFAEQHTSWPLVFKQRLYEYIYAEAKLLAYAQISFVRQILMLCFVMLQVYRKRQDRVDMSLCIYLIKPFVDPRWQQYRRMCLCQCH
jgi:hypothetical protein